MATGFNTSVLSRRELLGLAVGAAGSSLLPSSLWANAGQTAAPTLTANPKFADPKQTLPRTVALLEKPNSEAFNTDCSPGAGGRGPMRELGRFYEMLLNRGQLEGRRILSSQTVEAITARHRAGMLYQTFGIALDWSLGFIVDAFLYGSHCSDRAFGHAGAQSSVGFCDPEYGLVVAMALNGMPGPTPHNQRMLDLANAIYLDLGLAKEGEPGKPRELPKVG